MQLAARAGRAGRLGAARLLLAAALVVQAGYFAMAGARSTSDDLSRSSPRPTHAYGSIYFRCSAPTTPTSRSAC